MARWPASLSGAIPASGCCSSACISRLLVGYYDERGKDLIYAGKVGTGYTRDMLLELRARLDGLEQPSSPFTRGDPPAGEHVHWVKPQLVAEIAFSEWTQNDLLRQPRF